MVFARMVVHDPEVETSGPIDYADISRLAPPALADGVSGYSVSRSSIEGMNEVMKILDEDLRQGALGLGVRAAYMANGLTSYEFFAAQRAAANYDRLTSVHTWYHLSNEPPTEAPIAFDEIFSNAMLLDAPLLMAHNNDYGW